jgi:hypothetical protein
VLEVRAAASPAGAVRLALRLRDGRAFVASDDAPGWDDFVDAAESALPGLPRRAAWWPAAAAGAAAPALLFRRAGRG